MEFYKDDKVIVNPLRIRSQYQHELEFNMLMCHRYQPLVFYHHRGAVFQCAEEVGEKY